MMEAINYWIAVGDLHGEAAQVGRIPDIGGAGGVLISGDITNRGTGAEAARILDTVARFNQRIYAQIGNMDTGDVEDLLEARGINVHARVVDLGSGVSLLGMGYSTPTPFGTPSEVGDKQLEAWLANAVDRDTDPKRLIFMPHNPPFDTFTDRVRTGQPVGSLAVRRFIEAHQPAVCVTGHIHESTAVDRLGDTRIVNPGCLRFGGYVWIGFVDGVLSAELRRLDAEGSG